MDTQTITKHKVGENMQETKKRVSDHRRISVDVKNLVFYGGSSDSRILRISVINQVKMTEKTTACSLATFTLLLLACKSHERIPTERVASTKSNAYATTPISHLTLYIARPQCVHSLCVHTLLITSGLEAV